MTKNEESRKNKIISEREHKQYVQDEANYKKA